MVEIKKRSGRESRGFSTLPGNVQHIDNEDTGTVLCYVADTVPTRSIANETYVVYQRSSSLLRTPLFNVVR
jgi:hypothetical protein